MTDKRTSAPDLKLVGSAGEKSNDALRAELEALKYENSKLKVINNVLVQRVEQGWGNVSTAYSSFQRAAMLTEQVASKSKALQETRNRLDETREHLDRTQTERDQSRQRLEDLIEAIPDAVALFDEERLLVLGNASFFEFWAGSGAVIEVGKTRLTDLGRLAANHGLFDSDSRSAGRTSSPRSEAGDSLFRMADGRWLQMAERATVDGGLVVAYTDVTEVKASELNARERTVRAHDNLLHELLANLPQGVALVDEAGCIRVCNPRFRKLLRYEGSLQGREVPLTEVLQQSPIGAALGDVSTLWSGCDPARNGCQQEVKLNDGTVLDMGSHPLLDGGYVVTFTDVTARSRDARVIREGAQRLRFMTDSLPALIAYVNREGVYEFANRSFEDWYDRPRHQVEGATIAELLGPDEFSKHQLHIDRVLSGQTANFEIEQVLPDGRKQIFTKSYVPHRDEAGVVIGFFVLEQDVTEQRRTASALKYAYRHMEQRVFERTRELSDLNDQLQAEVEERAQIERHLLEATREARTASESKVKFMAAAGHDLLQPLNAARLFASAMLEEELDGRVERLASSLTRSLDDVESIITTLVDISKLEAGVVEAAPEPFLVDSLLSTLSDEFSALASEAGLEFRYVRSSVVVHTDSQLLARILRNLLTNALRYTDQGRVVLGCRRRPSGLDIEVADTGIGIEEDQLQLIFGEFQRAETGRIRDERGLGLGLAIVDKLSGVLGCSVSVRSLPSHGSVFTVHVPYGELSEKHLTPVPELPELANLVALEDVPVLVVDNDPAILEGMETVLQRWGCKVATARNLASMDECLREGFIPEIAILDYQLDRDLTGFAVATVLQDRLEDMPGVLMITANYSRELRMQAAASGFALLHKPVRPHKLRSVMLRLLPNA